MTRKMLVAAAILAALPTLGFAQDNAAAVKQALMEADHKMMNAMHAVPMTGDADKDFVGMMIAHHQGAIDMAKVELQYGKDPQMRALAEEIIKAQEKEIADMKRWQSEHP
jgi:uncharacterized protein (DUF305 family)